MCEDSIYKQEIL